VVKPHHAFHQRRFTGAVFAEQGVKTTLVDLHRDIVQRFQRAEPHAHRYCFYA
jgi:hypothetical protein